MDIASLPTKGNLMQARNTLKMSRLGYDLMDKKRNVLIREIMELSKKAEIIQESIRTTFEEAYKALEEVNISMGVGNVELISYGAPIENTIEVKSRSVMGVEIPMISHNSTLSDTPFYGLITTTIKLDEAYYQFNKVKELTIQLAEIETIAYRLAFNIKKTQKRANSLKNITIPKYEALTKQITETLEERERDEFTRLKVAKKGNERA